MKPNIIFVLLDGSRWDRLHISPEFSKLKKDGTLLTNVTTTAPYTFASMNSIFTGLYGKESGVNAYYKMFRLKDSVNYLPEILSKNGYYTSCDLISEKVISSRGFDLYQSHDEYKDDLTIRHPRLIEDSLKKANGKPIFLFLQFSRIHTVTVSEVLKKYEWDDKKYYEKKEENLKTYDDVFLEATKYAIKIKNTIEKLNMLQNTILIFFSDHGTGIGERFGERNYGVFLHEETIRTIYLFISPKIKTNQEFSNMFSTIDVMPTILDLCNIDMRENLPGNSFISFLTGKPDISKQSEYTFSETGGLQGPFPSPMEPNVFCVKNMDYKLIFFKATGEWKLYNLKNDPLEHTNMHDKDLDIEPILKEKLENWIKR